MKNKIKKWHIALMSFMALFIAIFASLFSLRADTVDEETGEVLTDNWELGIVFYDSTVDNGKTPLTEINWDASDGGYQEGTPRVITVQINYKNTNTVTTYEPGELTISIPNLAYDTDIFYYDTTWSTANKPLWSSSIIVGANDSTHTGYDWDFSTGSSPTNTQKIYTFTNANIIEEKSNFEGSIQIVYTITPKSESIEKYADECTHAYKMKLQAALGKTEDNMTISTQLNNVEKLFTSPNWPNNYENNMSTSTYYWEYTSENLKNLIVSFEPTSTLRSGDYIYLYNKNGTMLQSLSGKNMAGNAYFITGNYIKIAMSSNYYSTDKGFSVSIGSDLEKVINIPDTMIASNEINLNYTRTYSHSWVHEEVSFSKIAEKITSYDGLGTNPENYIWVKYLFKLGYVSEEYPYVGMDYETALIYDVLPEGCICYTYNGEKIETTDDTGLYIIDQSCGGWYGNERIIFVGYPKVLYNNDAGNLLITNTAEYYGYWNDSPSELSFLNTSSTTINLSDFEFEYSGNLFSISKSAPTRFNNGLRYQDIVNNWEYNMAGWEIYPTIYNTGNLLTVKIGDDLMLATNKSGNVVKLNDEDYCFTHIQMCPLYNGNGVKIKNGKYNCELWVRYAGATEYALYEKFTIFNGGEPTNADPDGWGVWKFSEDQKIVGYYFLIKDLVESIAPLNAYNGYILSHVKFYKQDIEQIGTLYNLCYLQVYYKDENGNLILQNEPTIDSYANMVTKDKIAQYDQDTYRTYMQRAAAEIPWKYYNVNQSSIDLYAIKNNQGSIIQDEKNELFIGEYYIGAKIGSNIQLQTNYLKDYSTEYCITGFKIHDLLPQGMEVISTEEEILNSLYFSLDSSSHGYPNFYSTNYDPISLDEFKQLIINNQTISIIPNWKNTGRTKIDIIIDLTNNPLLIFGRTASSFTDAFIHMKYFLKYQIKYDSFLEYGHVYNNYCYVSANDNDKHINFHSINISGNSQTVSDVGITDNGKFDIDANDINENNNTSDYISYSKVTTTINSIISTHQDVTKYVKTDQSSYSTGIVDTSNNSEYEYKLRVRTGQNNITNLILYDSVETAQPERTRWQGEFLGIDTSYAENKIYKLLDADNPNADSEGYVTYTIDVKTYYSENANAGNLYNENGTINSDWLEYDETTVNKLNVKALAFEYLDTAGNPAVLPANSLTYVLIKMKSPDDESITTLARNECRTQWNALDDYDRPVDFITGINSNVVKVALPNSIKADDLPSISLKFTKEIQGGISDFENLKLNKADEHIFMIRLTSLIANDDGSYNQVTGLLSSTQGLVITQIPIGTYLLEELGDNYFDFVNFTDNNDPELIIEGVTFEKTDQGYIITVSEDLSETVEFNIKVTNKTEDERFYEDKFSQENLFLKNKIESGEDPETPI